MGCTSVCIVKWDRTDVHAQHDAKFKHPFGLDQGMCLHKPAGGFFKLRPTQRKAQDVETTWCK